MSDVAERIKGLVSGFDARVQAAPSHAWNNASPCEGWTAKDVVHHVSGNLLRIGGAMQGAELAAPGDDESTVQMWDRARDALLAHIDTADLSAEAPGPMGMMPLEHILGRFVANDILVHTWDIARATGGDEQLPAEIVAAAHSGLLPVADMMRRPGVFGPAVEAPEGADAQTQFLSFLGRQV
jgi:uncharacterized protein (TIGR03086 family)